MSQAIHLTGAAPGEFNGRVPVKVTALGRMTASATAMLEKPK